MWRSVVFDGTVENIRMICDHLPGAPPKILNVAHDVYASQQDRYSFRDDRQPDGSFWTVHRVLGVVYVEHYRPTLAGEDPLKASALLHCCHYLERRRLRPIAVSAVYRGSNSDVKTDICAALSIEDRNLFPDPPGEILRAAFRELRRMPADRTPSMAFQHDDGNLRWYVEVTDHPTNHVLIHVSNREPSALSFRESCRAGIMPSPHQMRREHLRDREQTRWRVVVHDCRSGRAAAEDGTPCLDTYTKAGFSTITAAERWIAQHPCGRCCAIIDAHLELPWGRELFDASVASMQRERDRLLAVAQQRRERRRCEGCDKTGVDEPSVQYRPRIDGGQYMCDACATAAIRPITDEDVIADRYTQHVNRLGYDAELPDEIREYHESEAEWLRRFPNSLAKDAL